MDVRELEDIATGGVDNDQPLALLVGDIDRSDVLVSQLKKSSDGPRFEQCEFISVGTVDGARAEVNRRPPSCIVAQHPLQDGSAVELLRAVRGGGWQFPFILWGSASHEELSEAVAYGLSAYVPQEGPEAYDTLTDRLRELLTDLPAGAVAHIPAAEYATTMERQRFFYDSLQQVFEIGVFEIYPETMMVTASDGLRNIDELRESDTIPFEEALEIVHPSDRDRVARTVEEVLSTHDPYMVEYRLLDDSGSIEYVVNWGRVVTNDEGEIELIRGVSKNISNVRRAERLLELLYEFNYRADRATQAAEVIEAARRVFDSIPELTDSAIYLFDDDAGELVLESSGDHSGPFGIAQSYVPGSGKVWTAFLEQETKLDSDVFSAHSLNDNNGASPTHQVTLPLGERGVVVIWANELSVHQGYTGHALESLVWGLERKLTELFQTKSLTQLELSQSVERAEFSRVEQLIEKLGNLQQSLERSNSHLAVDHIACDQLITTEFIDFAWVGEPDYTLDEFVVKAQSAMDNPYLREVPLGLGVDTEAETAAHPAVRATTSRDRIYEPKIPSDVEAGSWRAVALEYGFRTAYSIPLVYKQMFYGVLTVYSDNTEALGETTRDFLVRFARLVAANHHALRNKELLDTAEANMFVVSIDDDVDPFVKLAAESDSTVSVNNLHERDDDEVLVYFTSEDIEGPAEMLEAISECPVLSEGRQLGEASDGSLRFEAQASDGGQSLLLDILAFDAEFRTATVTPQNLSILVSLPHDESITTFGEEIKRIYPEASFQSQHDSDGFEFYGSDDLFEDFTDRQKEIFDAAYHAGYFDVPRASTATEVGEMLSITQGAFSQAYRKGLNKLLCRLYDQPSGQVRRN